MRFFTILLSLASLLATGALAAPEAQFSSTKSWRRPSWWPSRVPTCMSDSDAQDIADSFRESIVAYTDRLVLSAFTDNFHDYSDSVIELIDSGCPKRPIALGSATFDSRASFMAGQGAQPAIPFEQLNIWHTCNVVTLRWKSSGPGQEPKQITGIIVLENEYHNSKWLINTVYSEFNSGAWLVNLGIFKPSNCTA